MCFFASTYIKSIFINYFFMFIVKKNQQLNPTDKYADRCNDFISPGNLFYHTNFRPTFSCSSRKGQILIKITMNI